MGLGLGTLGDIATGAGLGFGGLPGTAKGGIGKGADMVGGVVTDTFSGESVSPYQPKPEHFEYQGPSSQSYNLRRQEAMENLRTGQFDYQARQKDTLASRQAIADEIAAQRAFAADPSKSVAQQQLLQAQDANMRQALALARSGAGVGGQASAMRQAQFQGAAAGQQTQQQAALLRAQESAQAQERIAQLTLQQRAMDLQAQGLSSENAFKMAEAELKAGVGYGTLAQSAEQQRLGGLMTYEQLRSGNEMAAQMAMAQLDAARDASLTQLGGTALALFGVGSDVSAKTAIQPLQTETQMPSVRPAGGVQTLALTPQVDPAAQRAMEAQAAAEDEADAQRRQSLALQFASGIQGAGTPDLSQAYAMLYESDRASKEQITKLETERDALRSLLDLQSGARQQSAGDRFSARVRNPELQAAMVGPQRSGEVLRSAAPAAANAVRGGVQGYLARTPVQGFGSAGREATPLEQAAFGRAMLEEQARWGREFGPDDPAARAKATDAALRRSFAGYGASRPRPTGTGIPPAGPSPDPALYPEGHFGEYPIGSDRESKRELQRLEAKVAGYESALRGPPAARYADIVQRPNTPALDEAYGRQMARAETRLPGERTPRHLSLTDAAASQPAYTYQYKPEYQRPPFGAPGRQVGIMAQDAAQNPAFAHTVRQLPNGKLGIDAGRLALANTAVESDMARRLQGVEARQAAEMRALDAIERQQLGQIRRAGR